jgi:hypothetical protein
MPSNGFNGWVFVPVSQLATTPNFCTSIGSLLCAWDDPANFLDWATSYLEIDNLGYYSVPATPKDSDYASIVTSLNASYTVNPIVINSVSTGTYQNNVLTTAPCQMQAAIIHPVGTFTWTSSNPAVATISATGLLTPKAVGTTDITVASVNNPAATATCTVNCVYGYCAMTCADNGNTDQATYGLKLRLRAVPSYVMPDTNIVWSIASGPATIATNAFDPLHLDSDLASAANVQCSMITFTGSGKVVVRASFITDPDVYSEYTFNVLPNLNQLSLSIIAAQALKESNFTAASWKVFSSALKAAVAINNAGITGASQDKINAAKLNLDTAVTNLVAASGTPSGSASSAASSESNPGTGTSSNVFPSLLIAVLALGGIAVTLKKTVLNK